MGSHLPASVELYWWVSFPCDGQRVHIGDWMRWPVMGWRNQKIMGWQSFRSSWPFILLLCFLNWHGAETRTISECSSKTFVENACFAHCLPSFRGACIAYHAQSHSEKINLTSPSNYFSQFLVSSTRWLENPLSTEVLMVKSSIYLENMWFEELDILQIWREIILPLVKKRCSFTCFTPSHAEFASATRTGMNVTSCSIGQIILQDIVSPNIPGFKLQMWGNEKNSALFNLSSALFNLSSSQYPQIQVCDNQKIRWNLTLWKTLWSAQWMFTNPRKTLTFKTPPWSGVPFGPSLLWSWRVSNCPWQSWAACMCGSLVFWKRCKTGWLSKLMWYDGITLLDLLDFRGNSSRKKIGIVNHGWCYAYRISWI